VKSAPTSDLEAKVPRRQRLEHHDGAETAAARGAAPRLWLVHPRSNLECICVDWSVDFVMGCRLRHFFAVLGRLGFLSS
jgi:hypothetical protein